MDPIRISVTADHIARGEKCDTKSCPIAIAFKEAFPDAADVSVEHESVTWTDADGSWIADLPDEGQDFIDRFDADDDDRLILGLDTPRPLTLELVPREPSEDTSDDEDMDDLDIDMDADDELEDDDFGDDPDDDDEIDENPERTADDDE